MSEQSEVENHPLIMLLAAGTFILLMSLGFGLHASAKHSHDASVSAVSH